MPDFFLFKMHPIQFRLGLRPYPTGELTALSRYHSWIYGIRKGKGIGRGVRGRGNLLQKAEGDRRLCV